MQMMSHTVSGWRMEKNFQQLVHLGKNIPSSVSFMHALTVGRRDYGTFITPIWMRTSLQIWAHFVMTVMSPNKLAEVGCPLKD